MLDLAPIKARLEANDEAEHAMAPLKNPMAQEMHDIRVLIAEVEQLRGALEFYADESEVLALLETDDPTAPIPTHSTYDCAIEGTPTTALAEFMRPALEALGRPVESVSNQPGEEA